MTDEERLIKEYGITCERKTIYSCHGHKYAKLDPKATVVQPRLDRR